MIDFDFTKEPGKIILDRDRQLNKSGVPLVSIITPYFNAGKYFEQTYNCVINQTFPWFEWVIVNDGSTNLQDIKILEQLVEDDQRIKVLHKENGGPASARNYAIQNTSTEIIVSLDSDDLIEPTFLETIYFALKFNPDAAWAYTDSIGFQDLEYVWKVPFSSEHMKTENFLIEVGAIRKKILLEVGSYDQREKFSHEDWHLWMKMLAKGYYPVHIGYYGAWYRRIEDGAFKMTLNHRQRQQKALLMIKKEADKITEEIAAKEYPSIGVAGIFKKPQKLDLGRKVFKNHNKIHIMMLIPWMEMGGADIFNLELVKKVDKNQFEMSIITTIRAENTWHQRFGEYVTDIFDLPSFLDVGNYPEFISYFISSREIDVIFLSNSYYGYYLIPWLRKEFPKVAIVDYVHMEEWYWRNGGFARTTGSMGDILERTFVCNERTRQILIDNFGRSPESVETLYIGVDEDKYDANLIKSGGIRKKFGISDKQPVILFPCRIHPQKRPFLMLEIAKQIRKYIPDIVFIVVGDGPQLDELKQRVNQYRLKDEIFFAGRQIDMRPYYKDSDITLICSIKEGLALTAYESLSMSTPVISADVGGQAELIDDKVGAILPLFHNEADDLDKRKFEQEEITQYVYAIKKILGDRVKYEQMCTECRNRIELKFSSDIMIEKLQNIFKKLVKDYILLNERIKVSDLINCLPRLIDDFVTIYNEYEIERHECDEIWQAREWYRCLYEEQLNQGKFTQEANAQKRLDEIYSMRSWKLIEKYRKFMDNTNMGKIIRKIMGHIRKVFNIERKAIN